ncbi:hypothetical protein L9F63_017463, partial [Diploptera punctata]
HPRMNKIIICLKLPFSHLHRIDRQSWRRLWIKIPLNLLIFASPYLYNTNNTIQGVT